MLPNTIVYSQNRTDSFRWGVFTLSDRNDANAPVPFARTEHSRLILHITLDHCEIIRKQGSYVAIVTDIDIKPVFNIHSIQFNFFILINQYIKVYTDKHICTQIWTSLTEEETVKTLTRS